MKVLFVCSGNNGISPIILEQYKSLISDDLQRALYAITGSGFMGYLFNIPKLMACIRKEKPDIVHAHYSFSGIAASISSRKPVICSLMGSDVKGALLWRILVKFFVRYVWAATVVKSEDMKVTLGLSSVRVIPNGVNLMKFTALDKTSCRQKLAWSTDRKVVLFASNPARPEKNYVLAEQSVKALGREDVDLKIVHGVNHNDMIYYLNASDVLLITSLWEGSPNVVKEAMSCCIPIVATHVGDIPLLFGNLDGYYLCKHAAADITNAIDLALSFGAPTSGKSRLIELGLESTIVASALIALYTGVRDRTQKRSQYKHKLEDG